MRSEAPGVRGRVDAMSLDLASLDSIRAFATELAGRLDAGGLPPLRGLVCNAGVQSGGRGSVTADGFESAFGVNHLGHFLLVELLRPLLEPPGPRCRRGQHRARSSQEGRPARP
jgi:NAD(P)-dependent dehydrogenase (short-subunit alcohol dehydrogenase family)